ncbi:MAG TPA: preprotein translocase subunit SecG [Planctomycetota bacterium]|nr:preprotein translocase subunit SecG [Planctomycetota bacterium]
MSTLTILFYILFVLAAIVLIVVILLQEGRGGGFGEALGTHGRETFGAGNRGINTFTAVTAGIFLASALLIHVLNRQTVAESAFGKDGGGPPAIENIAPPPDGGN